MAKNKGSKESVEYFTAAPNPEFRSLLEHTERGVVIMDAQLVVRWFNANAAHGIKILTNNRLKVGKSYWDYVIRDANKTFFRNFNIALKGKSVSVEKKLNLDSGRVIWVDGRFTPLQDKEGKTIGVIYSYKNITRKKKLEQNKQEKERLLRAISSNENHAFMLVDTKFHVKDFNSGWKKVLPTSDVIKQGAGLFDCLPDDWKEDILGGLLICRNGGKVTLELADPIYPEKISEFHLSKVDGLTKTEFHYVIWGDDISEKVKTKNALHRSESNMKAMLNNSSQSFFLLDRDLNVEAYNRSALKTVKQLYGKDLEIGKPLSHFLKGENIIQLREEARRAFQGKPIQVEKYLNLNGRECWFERHYNPEVIPGTREIERITIWSMDITERKMAEKALRESEKRFKQLASLTPVGIYQTDKHGNTVYMNDSLLRTLNADLSEALTGEWKQKVHEEDRARVRAVWNAVGDRAKEFSIEYRIQQPDGDVTYVIETGQPMYNNLDQYTGMIGTVLDISQNKANQQLGEQKALAEQSLKFRSDFLASMSHEMRTPLNGILGMSEALINSQLSEDQSKQVDNIFSSAMDLRSIVNEVLDLAKIEAGKTTLEMGEISMEELIDTILTRHLLEAHKKGLELTWEPGLEEGMIRTDRRRLIQVLSNLVRNAIKFTESGKVKVIATRTSEDKLKFEVRDTGYGIKESEISKLFKDFSQLDHTTAQALEGTGLGLSICRKLVEMLGGEIGVESTPDHGSTFWFTIRSDGSNEKPETINPDSIKLRVEFPHKTKVLLVEDNAINQQAFKMMLEKIGCIVSMASDGVEAVKMARDKTYDIIFMDIQMPRMDGITATRTIKEENPESLTPIIGLSGNVIDRDNNGRLSSDMDDMLLKPVISAELKKMLYKWVAA